MSRPTKPAVSPTSARTSRPSRASTSKRVSYQEQDGDEGMAVDRQSDGDEDGDDLEDAGDGQQDGSSGEPVVHKLARIMEKYEKSTIKPTEQRLASAQRDLRQIVDKGKREADSSVHKQLERNTALVNAAHLDRPKSLVTRSSADHESALLAVELQEQCLATAIEVSIMQGFKPDGAKDWLVAAQQALEARPRAARRTLKRTRESKRGLLDELHELDQDSAQQGESMRQHFVEIALA
ncbi:hypothetical protein JCM3775_004979 [Rhodotorula graminis]